MGIPKGFVRWLIGFIVVVGSNGFFSQLFAETLATDLGVPTVQQSYRSCGAANAWMILHYYRYNVSLGEVEAKLYRDVYIWQIPPVLSLLSSGKVTGESLRTSENAWLSLLQQEISNTNPVIVLIPDLRNLGRWSYNIAHYITVRGFDTNGNIIYNDSVDNSRQIVSQKAFALAWGTSSGYAKSWQYIATRKAKEDSRPVLTSGLRIIQSPPFYDQQSVSIIFTVANKGLSTIFFDVLTVGGRDPTDQVADFTWKRSVTIAPGASFNYLGAPILTKVGKYHFFAAYRTADGKWNTSIPTEVGIPNTLDIFVNPPIATPTPTSTPTRTTTNTPTSTPIIIAKPSSTLTSILTTTPSQTSTRTQTLIATPTATATPLFTPTPTQTNTPTPTSTFAPPTLTATSTVVPTPLPTQTSSQTNTTTPANTLTRIPTSTPTTTIVPDLHVELQPVPNSGLAPLTVNLTTRVWGSANGPTLYRFACDGNSFGSWTDSSTQPCIYQNGGIFRPAVQVQRQGLTVGGSAQVNVSMPVPTATPTTIPPTPSLFVALTANPSSGSASLISQITIAVSGTASGPFQYKLDCTADGPWEYIFINTSLSVTKPCLYPTVGDYNVRAEVTSQGQTVGKTEIGLVKVR